MILALLKYNLKTNRFLLIAILAVMAMYLSIMTSMYDPANANALEAMLEIFPEGMIQALGFSNFGTSLLTFIVGYIYAFLILLFPMIFVVVANHKMIASLVDKGSMAYLLSTPNSRVKVIFTQAISSILLVSLLLIGITIIGIGSAEIFFSGELEIMEYVQVNLYALALYFAISSLIFLGSSIASESRYSLAIGIGFPVSFLLIQMISDVGEKFAWLENLTLYSLFDPQRLVQGDTEFALMPSGILIGIAIVLYSTSIYLFNKRNLYI